VQTITLPCYLQAWSRLLCFDDRALQPAGARAAPPELLYRRHQRALTAGIRSSMIQGEGLGVHIERAYRHLLTDRRLRLELIPKAARGDAELFHTKTSSTVGDPAYSRR
jgi:hypothetical protein